MPQLPDFDLSQLRHVYAGSILEQFASDHDAPAILRELAQNEFDGGGSILRLAFGSDLLEVSGNGRGIDPKGWRRLSLTLGTGQSQAGDRVEEKKNSIGSKNFGLRSLFRWGDRISVRSKGLATLLELRAGVLPEPIRDPLSKDLVGVLIQVPFRTAPSKTMPGFSADDERAALAEMETSAAGSLLKLLTGSKQGLREVHITSDRCGMALHWKQSMRKQESAGAKREVLKRLASLKVTDGSDVRTSRIEELEFRKAIVIPPGFRTKQFAAYFAAGKGRLWVSISVSCRGGKALTSEPGRFYYPILVDKGWTGCSLNVSAPFEMDGDRSELRSSSGEPWNRWLMEEAAAFTAELVRDELCQRFGKAAWSLLVKRQEPADSVFLDRVMTALGENEIWPVNKGRHIIFKRAKECAVAHAPEFYDFLGEERYIIKEVAADLELRQLAERSGVTPFDLDRVIAFRVAGEKDQPKWFKAGIRWFSPAFPDQWRDIPIQIKFAEVLEKHWKDLSEEKRRTIEEAPSALAANSSLSKYIALSSVAPDVARTLGIPPEEQLHSSLRRFRRSLELCRKFDFRAWVAEVANRVAKGEASVDEREALYSQIVGGAISSRDEIRRLRGYAVFRDHRGEWTKASSMVSKTAKGARELEPVLRFPAAAMASRRDLVKYLSIAAKLTAEDLLRLFEAVETRPDLAPLALQMLSRYEKTLLPRIYAQVSRLKFISIQGALQSPRELYATSAKNRECLGEEVEYASMLTPRMQVNLGCKLLPAAEDLIARLLRLRERSMDPGVVIYKVLAQAIDAERADRAEILTQPIFWDGSTFVTGSELLLSHKHRHHFLGLYGPGPPDKDMASAFAAIGVATVPAQEHWLHLLLHLVEQVKSLPSVPPKLRRVFQEIYGNLKASSAELPIQLKCLLAEDGRLYSMADARALRILIADQSDISAAIRSEGVAALCDPGEAGGLGFFVAVGVRGLSDVAKLVGTTPGRSVEQESVLRLREWLKSPSFRSAVKSLVRGLQIPFNGRPDSTVTKTCVGASAFVAVDKVSATYRIGQRRFTVAKPYYLRHNVVYISSGQGRLQMLSSLSDAIAVQICRGQQDELALHLQAVLSSHRAGEVREYLAGRNIPWLQISGANQDSLFDSPEVNLGDILEDSLKPRPGDEKPRHTPPGRKQEEAPARKPLPPLGDVRLAHESPTGVVVSRAGKRAVGSGGYGGGTTRLPDTEYDRTLGKRGEELVYLEEIEKVEANGFDKERVLWTSTDDPLAPWDIVSVDGEGNDVWLEVKSTTGRDGRFVWSAAEVRTAAAKADRYVLVRIYEVDSTTPTRKDFPDPMSLFQNGILNIEVGSLSAEVEGL